MKLFKVAFTYVAEDDHKPSSVFDPKSFAADKSVVAILTVRAVELEPITASPTKNPRSDGKPND